MRMKNQLAKLDLLILDELGYVPASKLGSELLFDVISAAYERTSVIVTTNLPFEQWTADQSEQKPCHSYPGATEAAAPAGYMRARRAGYFWGRAVNTARASHRRCALAIFTVRLQSVYLKVRDPTRTQGPGSSCSLLAAGILWWILSTLYLLDSCPFFGSDRPVDTDLLRRDFLSNLEQLVFTIFFTLPYIT